MATVLPLSLDKMRPTSAYAVLSILMHLEILFLLNKPADAPVEYSSLRFQTILANACLTVLICLDFSLHEHKYDTPAFSESFSIFRAVFGTCVVFWHNALVDLASAVDTSTSADVLIPFGAGILLFVFYAVFTAMRIVRIEVLTSPPDVYSTQNPYERDLEEGPLTVHRPHEV